RERLDLLEQIGSALLGGTAWPSLRRSDQVDVDDPTVRRRLAFNTGRVHAMGHYQGGMLRYEGEWYWGLDRLPLLVARLRDEGLELPDELANSPHPHVAAEERIE